MDGNWKCVITKLRSGQYQPLPIRQIEIDKLDGSISHLGIPTVVDRLLQQAITHDKRLFRSNRLGFRPSQNGKKLVIQVKGIIKTGRLFAVDLDILEFFTCVIHGLLLVKLGCKMKDKRLLK